MTIRVKGLKALKARLNAVSQERTLSRALVNAAAITVNWSKDMRLSGPRPQYLGVVTGRLRSSIAHSQPERIGNVHRIAIGTNVEYARVHEYGGMAGRNHLVKIPARPYLRPAFEDKMNISKMTESINDDIRNALETARIEGE